MAAITIDPNILIPQGSIGRATNYPEFYDEVIAAINDHASLIDSSGGGSSDWPWVDMRVSPYDLVADSTAAAAANTAKLKAALTAYAAIPAQFLFPMGVISFDKGTGGDTDCIVIDGATHTAPKIFVGMGQDVTTLQQVTAGNGGEINLFRFANGHRGSKVRSMTLQIGNNASPDNVDNMYVVKIVNSAGAQRTGDIEISDVKFGKGIGAGVQILGETDTDAHYCDSVFIHHCTFDLRGISRFSCVPTADIVDGEYVTVFDGSTTVLYEFDVAGNGVTGGRTQVNISTDTTAAEVATRLRAAIVATQTALTVNDHGDGELSLVRMTGTAAQQRIIISEDVADADFGAANGSRSGIEPQRGVVNLKVHHCYFAGAKNTLFDSEPTGTTTQMDRWDISFCVFDNQYGRTPIPVSLGGIGSTQRTTKSRFQHNYVLGGQVICFSTDQWDISDNVLFLDGTNLGEYDFTDAPLLYFYGGNSDVTLHCNTLIRTANADPGALIEMTPSDPGYSTNITIEGGNWIQATDSTMVIAQSVTQLSIHGLSIRFEGATPATYNALTINSDVADITQIDIRGCKVVSSTGKLNSFVQFSSQEGHDVSNVSVTNNDAANQVTYGVVFDKPLDGGGLTHAGTNDRNPLIQGNDFTGATLDYICINDAVDTVFPIISGNRGGICTMMGDVDPEGEIVAIQGCSYVWRNGDSTSLHFKLTGVSDTGWGEVTVT